MVMVVMMVVVVVVMMVQEEMEEEGGGGGGGGGGCTHTYTHTRPLLIFFRGEGHRSRRLAAVPLASCPYLNAGTDLFV